MPDNTGRKLVVLPSRSVGQAELLALIQIENELDRLLRERDRLTKSIIERIQSGESVELGIYRASVRDIYSAGRRIVRLILG